MSDFIHNLIDVVHHFIIAEPYHFDSEFGLHRSSHLVIIPRIRIVMDSSIDFDHKFDLMRKEIYDKLVQWVLAAELYD